MLRVKGNYKRTRDRKLLQGIISEETKKCNKKLRRQKAGERAVGCIVLTGCTVLAGKAFLQWCIFFCFLLFFPLVFDLQC